MQKSKRYIILNLLFVFINMVCYGQEYKKLTHDSYKKYANGDYISAASILKNVTKTTADYYKANFNLGDALYKMAYNIKTGKIPVPNKKITKDSAASLVFEQAAEQFEIVAKSVSNPDTIHKAWHNYGNSKLFQGQLEDAIYGYKKALKVNPNDEDTRYNLAFAQRLKKEQDKKNQQQQKQNQQQQKQDKKEQQKQDKQKKQDQKQDQQKQQQQQKMSKEQAEKMLKAVMNEDKKKQGAKKKAMSGDQKQIEKDW